MAENLVVMMDLLVLTMVVKKAVKKDGKMVVMLVET